MTHHVVASPTQQAHIVRTCMILHLISTANTLTQLAIGSGLWMMCYLVISRKLRRVERSSRRLICLWHWLQKKSSASSLRKLWKQSGRGAGALERGNREEEEEEVVSDGRERVRWGGTGHLCGCRGVLVKSTGKLERVKCEGYSGKETWNRLQCGCELVSGECEETKLSGRNHVLMSLQHR